MFSAEIHNCISNWLIANFGNDCIINNIIPLTGGSINQAYRLNSACGDFLLKYNLASLYPEMFKLEMKGLLLIAQTNTIYIPKPLYTDTAGKYSFLLMEFEHAAIPDKGYWQLFANQLAALHHHTSGQYGLEYDNYIGSLPQSNTLSSNYHDFLINHRMQPLIKSAVDAQLLSRDDVIQFDKLYNKLTHILPIEKPDLIHGDLWSGNLIVNHQGKPCLIDPAVYYGQRESDIAMTKLFGGFPSLFYDTYNDVFPMVKGWEQRIEINQLYPLLVHVNLFGQSYVSQIRQIIKRF